MQETEFVKEFRRYHHRDPVMNKNAHWCHDWDLMPIDETCEEFHTCGCVDPKD